MFTANEMHKLAEQNCDKKVREGYSLICNAIKMHAENGDFSLRVELDETLKWSALKYAKEELINQGFDCKLIAPSEKFSDSGYLLINW